MNLITLQWTALVTLAIVALLFGTAINVGRARAKYKVRAPATTGHELFERAYRIQMNTLENTLLVLPVLWLYALYGNPRWAALLGLAWLIGRIWYALAYAHDPRKRGGGFVLAMAAFSLLGVGAAFEVLRSLLLA